MRFFVSGDFSTVGIGDWFAIQGGFKTFCDKTFLEPIPSPKSVNLKGLREVCRVVVYHNDNAKPPGSPHGHFSTFAMSPTRCVQNNAASMQPYCCGAAGHDGTRNNVGHLPLGGSRRQLPDCPALFRSGTPVGHAVLGVLSSASLPC